jgi:peptide/nickel transport system ATP-binding protein
MAVERLRVTSREGDPVRDVSFSIEPGRPLTLLGESGSGKSLLAQAMLGTLAPSLAAGGRVTVLGNVSDAGDAAARRCLWGSTLSLLPQEPWLALDPTMRVGRQLAETHYIVGRRQRAEALQRTAADLAGAGIIGRDPWPHTLSGGMAQRVAFAVSRAGGAPILIVDEPTKGLDAPLRDALIAKLQALLADGGSVLVITHDIHVARALPGDIAVMLDGRIIEHGATATILSSPTHEYTRRLLAADPGTWVPRPASRAAGTPIVSIDRVTKRYGGHTVLDQFSLDVHGGERMVFAGPSGSGKSTLGNVVLGLVPPDEGRVQRSPKVGPLGFQKLYQDPVAAFPARVTLGTAFDDVIALHGLARAELTRLLHHLGLDAVLLRRTPSEVSGGELQRLALARVLMMKPALVFADEPTSRLDPISQQISLDLLMTTVEETGTALILVTHDPGIARAANGRTIQLDVPA